MKRPSSDHFDGERFFNPGQKPDSRGFGAVLRWRLRERHVPWGSLPPDPVFPPPAEKVAAGTVSVTFIGHSTFLLRLPGFTVLTDPVFSERCSPVPWAGPRRARPPGLALDDLPPVNLVIVSHNHYDHMDLPSLRQLAARRTGHAITTAGNAAILRRAGFERVDELDWWEMAPAGPLQVTATPARHFSRRSPADANRTLWAGFNLSGPDGQILFAGDSGAGPHWTAIRERLGPPGLALLPIGAYEPRWLMAPVHMNPAEAAQAHRELGAAQSIGMHFGTFQLTDEAIDAPVLGLAAAGVTDFTTLGFGQTQSFALKRRP